MHARMKNSEILLIQPCTWYRKNSNDYFLGGFREGVSHCKITRQIWVEGS